MLTGPIKTMPQRSSRAQAMNAPTAAPLNGAPSSGTIMSICKA